MHARLQALCALPLILLVTHTYSCSLSLSHTYTFTFTFTISPYPGKKFRVPGFLATSFDEGVAFGFLQRAHMDTGVAVAMWRVHVDPEGERDPRHRCLQVCVCVCVGVFVWKGT